MVKMRVLDFVEPLAEHLAGQPADGVSLYWLGQAGFLIRAGGRTLLIDPYLSDSLAEKYRGTRFPHERMMPPPIAIGELPPVDCVLVTHQHTDHMDPQTLAPIAKAFPACRFIVPRASTHLDYTDIPLVLPASRYGQALTSRYVQGWLDHYLKHRDTRSTLLASRLRYLEPVGDGRWAPVTLRTRDLMSYQFCSAYWFRQAGQRYADGDVTGAGCR